MKEREREKHISNMGRAPCCDKANVKKGPWSPEEDAKLKAYIEQHGIGEEVALKKSRATSRLKMNGNNSGLKNVAL